MARQYLNTTTSFPSKLGRLPLDRQRVRWHGQNIVGNPSLGRLPLDRQRVRWPGQNTVGNPSLGRLPLDRQRVRWRGQNIVGNPSLGRLPTRALAVQVSKLVPVTRRPGPDEASRVEMLKPCRVQDLSARACR